MRYVQVVHALHTVCLAHRGQDQGVKVDEKFACLGVTHEKRSVEAVQGH